MAAAQLRLLSVFGFELFTNAVEKLYIGLLWVSLESSDEGPGHGPSGLTSDIGVLSITKPRCQ